MAFYMSSYHHIYIYIYIYIYTPIPKLITGFISENKWMPYFVYMILFDSVKSPTPKSVELHYRMCCQAV